MQVPPRRIKEAVNYIEMSLSYLQHDHYYGVTGNKTPGATFIRVGCSIQYLKADLDEWLLNNCVNRGV